MLKGHFYQCFSPLAQENTAQAAIENEAFKNPQRIKKAPSLATRGLKSTVYWRVEETTGCANLLHNKASISGVCCIAAKFTEFCTSS
jgi:hypothetical protein